MNYEFVDEQENQTPLIEYEKQTWINHLVTDDTHEVIQEGSVLEAKRFNHMEDGITACASAINTLSNNMKSVSDTAQKIENKGFVASVTYIEDEEDEDESQKLVFTMSDGSTLSVAIGATQTYQVNYFDDSRLIFSDIVKAGKNSTYSETPTRVNTAQYTYNFLGWSSTPDGEVEEGLQNEITSNINLYAVFEAITRSYMVTFMSEGQTLYSGELEYGEVPEYDGSALSNGDGRPFDKWTPEPESVKGSITYNASFKHRVRYYNGDTLLKTEYVGDGQTPDNTYLPTKSSTAQYSYTFTGWTSVKGSTAVEGNALREMSEDRDLYAIFNQTLRTYTVTWSINGTTQKATYFYGQTPVAPSVSAADGRSFSCWDKTVTSVTSDVTYTACYQRRVRFYNGSTLLTTQYVEYGANATYSGTKPTKASTNTANYTFSGWSSTSSGSASSTILNNITSDKDVYAAFTSSTRYYTVTFQNLSNNSQRQQKQATYKGSATYTGSTPTKPSTTQYNYTFRGWEFNSNDSYNLEGMSISGNTVKNVARSVDVWACFNQVAK